MDDESMAAIAILDGAKAFSSHITTLNKFVFY